MAHFLIHILLKIFQKKKVDFLEFYKKTIKKKNLKQKP
jgi:hypothetical protein